MAKKTTKKKERDAIWDALSAIYSEPVTKNDKSLRGKEITGLLEHRATPDEIPRRRALLIEEWGSKCDTAGALLKHWARYAPNKVVGKHVIYEHPIYTMIRRDHPDLLNQERFINGLVEKYESGEMSMANLRKKIREQEPSDE